MPPCRDCNSQSTFLEAKAMTTGHPTLPGRVTRRWFEKIAQNEAQSYFLSKVMRNVLY
jgi:hypothetical protein